MSHIDDLLEQMPCWPMSVLENQPVTFSFSIVRLLLAVTVFGIVFAVTKPLGSIGILIGLFISISIAAIVLIARRHHIGGIIRSLVWLGIGMFVGLLFCQRSVGRTNPATNCDI